MTNAKECRYSFIRLWIKSRHNFYMFFYERRVAHQNLHSFPTRRSSDLPRRGSTSSARPSRPRSTTSNSPDPLSIPDRKSTRLNSSHLGISYAVFCLKKKRNGKVKDGGKSTRNGMITKTHQITKKPSRYT